MCIFCRCLNRYNYELDSTVILASRDLYTHTHTQHIKSRILFIFPTTERTEEGERERKMIKIMLIIRIANEIETVWIVPYLYMECMQILFKYAKKEDMAISKNGNHAKNC